MIGSLVVLVVVAALGWLSGWWSGAADRRKVAQAYRDVIEARQTPAAVEWVCKKCGEVTPPQRGERRQLNLEVWDTYGHMIAQWPVGEGELLGSRPIGPWVVAEIGAVVASHNENSRRLQGVK